MKLHYLYIFILLIFVSCTEETTLHTDFKAQTFIYGVFANDGAKNLVITIQESVPIKNTSEELKPIKNAKITLFTKNSGGKISTLTNNFTEDKGTYKSSKTITPIIGNSYWLEVTLEDGTKFKSISEQFKKPVPINKISKVNALTRVSFKDPVDEKNFYKLRATSEIKQGSNISISTSDDKLVSDTFFNGNDDAFIDVDIRVGTNITINATLMSLSYNTYQFYLNVKAQQDAQVESEDNEGDPNQLFAPPPVHLKGNILNTTTNRRALGNFGIISINEY